MIKKEEEKRWWKQRGFFKGLSIGLALALIMVIISQILGY